MTTQSTPIGLYPQQVRDLRATITALSEDGYDFVAAPIVSPQFIRDFTNDRIQQRHTAFSRSDLILEANEWHQKIIARISDYIDCDSPNETIRKHSEKTLVQELSFAEHLMNGFVMIRLRSERNVNLARIVSRQIKNCVLLEVPMVDPKTLIHSLRKHNNPDESAVKSVVSDTWRWWNAFRLNADFDSKLWISLEMSADVPSQDELKRWLGEPVANVIIPAHIFIRNSKNFPVLSKGHQAVVLAFLRNKVGFMIKCHSNDRGLRQYSEYLRHLCSKNQIVDPMQGFDDFLEIPLQPLYDNLDAYTYEVFEKDPVKYLYYQKAIELALRDKVPDEEMDTRTLILMVVGAGRGPLVRAAINAATNTKRKIKIFVIEKNPNAVITLTALINEMWPEKDIQLISCDMRDFTPPEKADILVSELLGSFGDNELSPECLDGAQKHLKEDGISIPSKSTSYINPLMSSKIYNLVRVIDKNRNPREKLHHYAEQSEMTYVIYFKNVYHIADPQPLFEFVHPNKAEHIDNSRFASLTFTASLDSVLTGFAGYFDTVLYKDIILSIHPQTHSRGMASWFSVYFPISEPMQLKAGDTVTVNFWRCIASHKVWYEWSVSHPTITHIHNHNGRHCPIYM